MKNTSTNPEKTSFNGTAVSIAQHPSISNTIPFSLNLKDIPKKTLKPLPLFYTNVKDMFIPLKRAKHIYENIMY